MRREILPLLACPGCHGDLALREARGTEDRVLEATFTCAACHVETQVEDGVALFVPPEAIADDHWLKVAEQLAQEGLDLLTFDAQYHDSLAPGFREAMGQVGQRMAQRVKLLIESYEASPAPVVVDVASGRGMGLRALAPVLAPDVLLVATDYSPSILGVTRQDLTAKGYGDVLSLVACDARALPFRTGALPAITTYMGLSNIPAADTALAEVGRTLAPSGSFVGVFMELDEGTESLRLMVEYDMGEMANEARVRAALARHGLRLVDWERVYRDTWPGNPYDALPVAGDPCTYAAAVAQPDRQSK